MSRAALSPIFCKRTNPGRGRPGTIEDDPAHPASGGSTSRVPEEYCGADRIAEWTLSHAPGGAHPTPAAAAAAARRSVAVSSQDFLTQARLLGPRVHRRSDQPHALGHRGPELGRPFGSLAARRADAGEEKSSGFIGEQRWANP